MIGPQHVCALYMATAGLQGPALGSDEEEIVLLVYVIIDVNQNKLIGAQQYLVKPTSADVNDNVLSEQLTSGSVLTEELVKSAGQSLDVALRSFDHYARALGVDPNTPGFRLVTDGQLPLRQCLHPEACNKFIELPEYYCTFHDLRKELARFLGGSKLDEPVQSIKEMLTCLNMSPDIDNEFYIKEAKDMVNIIQRLISEGHRFEAPETINLVLEPGICSKDDEIDGNCVVRARGLPWQSSDQDIAKFFRGLNVAKGGVALCLSASGRRNGEALVRFTCQEHRDMALKRHKHHIGPRYIEVYRATGEDFLNIAGGASCEAQAFLSRGAQVIIRMRGLPYDCTPKQVLEFFAQGEQPCTVLDGHDGVLFVKKADGRATGDAFVLFAEETDAPKALSKHRELIGSRYIELFRSTTAEVQQVLNRCMDTLTYEKQPPLIAQLPQVPLLPQHIITSGTKKDCIRLRGLPYEAQVEHILDFLGEHAKNIVFQGVHMVYNAQGQPSGEAFIQMNFEQSAYMAAQQRHHRYMVFGKKQRYIEVFQCSGEDMNLVLTGGIPAPVSPAKAATAALLSPGMLNLPPTNVPPPPAPPNTTVAQISQNLVPAPNPALSWENPALFAQQQAQMIAQQTILARQNQAAQAQAHAHAAAAAAAQAHGEQIMLMNHIAAAHQANFALLNNPAAAGPPSPAKAPPQPQQIPLMSAATAPHFMHPQQHLFLVPHHHRLPPMGVQRAAPLMTHPAMMQGATSPIYPPHVAVKRSYGDAFTETAANAKRAFHFPTFYPNM